MSFNFEWERGDGVASPELAETWARLEIWVGSDCLTQLEDPDSGSSRRSIYCALYPLAEWAAYNWWFLKAHSRISSGGSARWAISPRARTGAWAHHSLRGAGDGFSWPDVEILPEGRFTRIAWRGSDHAEPHAVRFLKTGEALLRSEWVEAALSELVEAVITRLDERGVGTTPLADEWSSIIGMEPNERLFCESMARLGIDPYDAPEEIVAATLEAERTLDEWSLLRDLLDCVEPPRVVDGAEWIAHSSRMIDKGTAAGSDRLSMAGGGVHDGSWLLPWEVGYRHARDVRDHLDLPNDTALDIAPWLSTVEQPYDGKGILALGGRSSSDGQAVVLGRQVPSESARFIGARALWHFIFQPECTRFLVSDAYTDRQRVERAFAAELLAPAAGIAHCLGSATDFATQEDIEDVATHFNVSPMLVQWQVENQLATSDSADA